MALTSSILPPKENPDSAIASIWHAPLAPVALAVTAGIVADRAIGVPPTVALVALGVGLMGWVAGLSKSASAGLPFLWLALAAAGTLHHHQYRTMFAADDIGRPAGDESRLVRVRGRLAEEPTVAGPPVADPLRSMPRSELPARCSPSRTFKPRTIGARPRAKSAWSPPARSTACTSAISSRRSAD